MAQHEVAAEPVRGSHGTLQVHALPGGPPFYGCDVKRGHDSSTDEPPRPTFPDGETRPVHGDALTLGQIRVDASDVQLASSARAGDALDRADVADESREHVDQSLSENVVARSFPRVRLLTTGKRSRRASVAGFAPSNACSAAGPRETGACSRMRRWARFAST